MTADTYFDFTPASSLTSKQSFDSVVNVKSIDGDIDHSTLPELAKAQLTIEERYDCEILQTELPREVCYNVYDSKSLSNFREVCEVVVEIVETERNCKYRYTTRDVRSLGGMITEIVNAFDYIEEENNRMKTCAEDNLEYRDYRNCIIGGVTQQL